MDSLDKALARDRIKDEWYMARLEVMVRKRIDILQNVNAFAHLRRSVVRRIKV